MRDKINIFWFRRDLRTNDNIALSEALKLNTNVLPIFIYDSEILAELPTNDSRLTFIHELLKEINQQLQEVDRSLATFFGEPQNILEYLTTEYDVDAIYANHDYEPYAIHRDAKVAEFLNKKGIQFLTFKDQVIFERDDIVKDDGKPYVVFTPFANKWKATLQKSQLTNVEIKLKTKAFQQHDYPFLTLNAIGFEKSEIAPIPYNLSRSTLEKYAVNRDFPYKDSTTHLSPFLRFGAVSIRQVFSIAYAENNKKLIDELIWREFFMQILWHFPHTVTKSFKPQYDEIQWRNNENEFNAWKAGITGYPIVDAGIRELNATGIMHNRVRMVVAGFLCKHLLIDWRWGEAYFAEKLLDYEQSSNIGNWQWAAGSGVDAAPYFRIFNPTEQVKKFDKDLKYIKKWVPELEQLSYPQPIVDHKEAREQCLLAYKQALA